MPSFHPENSVFMLTIFPVFNQIRNLICLYCSHNVLGPVKPVFLSMMKLKYAASLTCDALRNKTQWSMLLLKNNQYRGVVLWPHTKQWVFSTLKLIIFQ